MMVCACVSSVVLPPSNLIGLWRTAHRMYYMEGCAPAYIYMTLPLLCNRHVSLRSLCVYMWCKWRITWHHVTSHDSQDVLYGRLRTSLYMEGCGPAYIWKVADQPIYRRLCTSLYMEGCGPVYIWKVAHQSIYGRLRTSLYIEGCAPVYIWKVAHQSIYGRLRTSLYIEGCAPVYI